MDGGLKGGWIFAGPALRELKEEGFGVFSIKVMMREKK